MQGSPSAVTLLPRFRVALVLPNGEGFTTELDGDEAPGFAGELHTAAEALENAYKATLAQPA